MNCVPAWLINGVMESGSRWSAWLWVASRASACDLARVERGGYVPGQLIGAQDGV